MGRIFKKKLAIAVNFIFLLISIILCQFSLKNYSVDLSMQSILINLATDFFGVFVLFIIINLVFDLKGESERIVEENNKLLASIKTSIEIGSNSLVPRNELGRKFKIAKSINNSKEILLLGYTHSGLLRTFRRELIDAINSGVKIKLIILDLNEDDLIRKFSSNYKRIKDIYEVGISTIKDIWQQTGKKGRANFEVRLTDWIPSCELIICYSKTSNPNIARIRIHPISFRSGEIYPSRILVINSHDNKDDFDYFVNQFQDLWEQDCKPYK